MNDNKTDLGPTGEFPEGKVRKDDQGELVFSVSSKEGNVFLDFGIETSWIGFPAEQAMEIGLTIMAHAEKILASRQAMIKQATKPKIII